MVEKMEDQARLVSSFSTHSNLDETRNKSSFPTGVTVTPAGNYVVADKGCLKVFDTKGSLLNMIVSDDLQDTYDVKCSRSGKILVTDPKCGDVKVFSKHGKYLVTSESGHLLEPCGIYYDKDTCQTCVADRATSCIFVHDAEGIVTQIITGKLRDLEAKTVSSRKSTAKSSSDHTATELVSPSYVTMDMNKNSIVSDTVTNTVSCFNNSTGSTEWRYGEIGSDDYQLQKPAGVCVDRFGNILIADSSNCRPQTPNTNCETIMATSVLSTHRSQLSSNQSAAAQHHKSQISTQQRSSVPQKTSLMRPRLMAAFSIRTFASHPRKKCNPTGLHVTKKGDFVLIDNNEKRAKIFSKMGRLIAEFGENRLKAPWDVTFLPGSSEIAISDPGDNMIKVFSKDGSFLKEFSGAKHLQEPYGITLSENSEILVADKGANCIYVHDKDGFIVNSIKPADTERSLFDWAQYMTTDLNGNILISDREKKSVKCITQKGDLVFCYKGEDNSATYNMDPRGVAVDKCGHVLVADGYKGNIVLLSNQGEYIRQLITSKEGLETPCALAVDKDDQLVITDAESEEIKVFSYLE